MSEKKQRFMKDSGEFEVSLVRRLQVQIDVKEATIKIHFRKLVFRLLQTSKTSKENQPQNCL